MATYIEICNFLLRRFNEVELTESTFGAAVGFHALVKDTVNDVINEINQIEQEWPFNQTKYTQLITPGQREYTFQANTKIDWHTMWLEKDDVLDVTGKHLPEMEYDIYVRRWKETDYAILDTSTAIYIPQFVYPTQAYNGWGVGLRPDRAYNITYEYWSIPTELMVSDDVPSIPDEYTRVIQLGAMPALYDFRENSQAAQMSKKDFKEALKDMRSLLINKQEKVYDTRINQRSMGAYGDWRF